MIWRLLLILLWAGGVACAAPPKTNGSVAGKVQNIAGKVQGVSGSASVTYLVSEDFDSGATPSGWKNNTITFNATPALDGTYSASATGSNYAASGSFTATGDVYAACVLEVGTALPTSTIFLKFHNGATELGGIRIRSTGKVQAISTQSTATPISVGSAIYIKMRYVKGTGSDSAVTIWTSSTGASGTWTQQATDSTGTYTSDATSIRIASASDGTNAVFKVDKLRVSTSDINY